MKKSRLFLFCFWATVVLSIVRAYPEDTVYASDVFVSNDVSAREQVIYSEIISVADDVDADSNVCKLLSDENIIFSTEPITAQNDNDYTVMHFEIPKNITVINSSTGQSTLLFTHTIYGSFYYYNDGKVYFHFVGSYIRNLHPNYSATITDKTMHNTDGTFAVAESTVVTSSSVGYPTPTLHFAVRIDEGSTTIGYTITEQY